MCSKQHRESMCVGYDVHGLQKDGECQLKAGGSTSWFGLLPEQQ